MKTLIKLEFKRSKMQTYVISSLIIAITMLCLLYLFAYAPKLEPDDRDMAIFSSYDNIVPLFGVLNMAVYCVLAAVMYTKFIIEDYSGKRSVLLFSYPVSRKKIMLSKLIAVSIFIILSMILSSFLNYLLFAATEHFLHLVGERLTIPVLLQAAETTLLMSLIAASAGIAAAGIGFIKKSIPTTIIAAVLISSFMCNVVANVASRRTVMYLSTVVILLASVMVSLILMKKADVMEVE